MHLPLEELLAILIRERGFQSVHEEFKQRVLREAALLGLNLLQYLDCFGLKNEYHNAKTRHQLDGGKLADFLRRMHLSLDLDLRSKPWNRWIEGRTACVILGDRSQLQKQQARLRPQLVGGGDVQGAAELLRLAQNELRINANWEMLCFAADLPPREAQATLREIMGGKDRQAVFVLGSPYTNPLADVMAREILQEPDLTKPPVRLRHRFRWHTQPRTWEGVEPFLSLREPCVLPGAEGICVANCGEEPTFPRTPDSIIYRELNSKKRNRVYADCGLLMMSCRESQPILCLLAGHGRIGTIATCLALSHQAALSRLLDEPYDDIPKDVVIAVIEVRRHKKTTEPVDDLVFERRCTEPGAKTGWWFGYPIDG